MKPVTLPMLAPAAVASINHLLRGSSWARDALLAHAGKTACFEIAPLALSLTVLPNGEVDVAPVGAGVAVTLRFTPGLALRLAARDENAWREVEVAGDPEFAAAINQLFRQLRWDVEEDLSRFFGDVAAHRMAETGRSFRRWGKQTAEHVGRSFAGYWTEEDPLITNTPELMEFYRDVDALRDDVARLEKRLENILNRQDAKGAKGAKRTGH